MVDKNTSFHMKHSNRLISLRTDLNSSSQIHPEGLKKWDVQNYTSLINKPKVIHHKSEILTQLPEALPDRCPRRSS
jgi:hypothetical protein